MMIMYAHFGTLNTQKLFTKEGQVPPLFNGSHSVFVKEVTGKLCTEKLTDTNYMLYYQSSGS